MLSTLFNKYLLNVNVVEFLDLKEPSAVSYKKFLYRDISSGIRLPGHRMGWQRARNSFQYWSQILIIPEYLKTLQIM